MTQPHDPLKAAAEQLSGFEDVWKVLHTMVRDAERRAGEAEVQLNALLKVRAIVGDQIDQQRLHVDGLRAAAAEQEAAKG